MVEPVPGLTRSRRSALGLRRRGEQLVAGAPGGPAHRGLPHQPLTAEPGPGEGWDRWGRWPRGAALRRLGHAFGAVRLEDRYQLVGPAGGSPGIRCISATRPIPAPCLPEPERAREVLAGCLEAVSGVGPVLAVQLRQAGITSLEQLAEVLRFRAAAQEVLSDWEAGDLESVCRRLTRRLGERGHLLSTLAASLVGIDQVAFFDLETMGLWNNTVFLAGVARVSGGSLTITQLLAASFADEAELIARTLDQLAGARAVVTFNGASADLPWLVNRAFYYGISPLPRFLHVDLVYGTRRRFGRGQDGLADVRLPTVCQHVLGRPRPAGDLPGWLIPEVYLHYSRRPGQREGMLVPILDHNQADLEALVGLLQVLGHEAQTCP